MRGRERRKERREKERGKRRGMCGGGRERVTEGTTDHRSYRAGPEMALYSPRVRRFILPSCCSPLLISYNCMFGSVLCLLSLGSTLGKSTFQFSTRLHKEKSPC